MYQFKLHFRVLLTDAFYHDTLTGTHCAQLTYAPGGLGGDSTTFAGQLWSDPLSPGGGEPLCPGTYQISVTVNFLGIGRSLKHRAKPLVPPHSRFDHDPTPVGHQVRSRV